MAQASKALPQLRQGQAGRVRSPQPRAADSRRVGTPLSSEHSVSLREAGALTGRLSGLERRPIRHKVSGWLPGPGVHGKRQLEICLFYFFPPSPSSSSSL